MPLTLPCPHCGKTLKILETLQGKTIRCPSCQQIFKAPPPAAQEEVPEVLPADDAPASTLVAPKPAPEPPVLELVNDDEGSNRRTTSAPRRGWGAGILVGILALVLFLCGGLGTLAFFVGKTLVNATLKAPTSRSTVVNNTPPPPPVPPPNPHPNPNPGPNPNPDPAPPPEGEPLKRVGDRLTIHARGTRMVRTLPDGKRLAAVGEDGVVKLLELPRFGSDPMTYRLTRMLPAIEGPIRSLAFHPSSQMAIVAGDHVHVYNDFTGELIASLTYQEPIAAVFQPAGLHLAIAVRKPDGQGSEIHLWDTRQKRDNGNPLKLTGKVADLAWPSGSYELAVAVDDEVRLYSTPDRDWRYYHTITTHQGSITSLAFRQGGQSLATIGSDKTIKLWTQKDGKLLRTYEGATNPIGRPAFTPDGSRLAVLGGPGGDTVHLWHSATGAPQGTLVLAPAQGANLDFLRDNRTLVLALRNEPLRFWTIPDPKVSGRPAPPPRRGKAEQPDEANRIDVPIAIDGVVFSPDGKTLAASHRTGGLMLLNVADWTQRAVKTIVAGPRVADRGLTLTLTYGGDGRLVCAGGGGKSARIYLRDDVSGEPRSDFPAGGGWVHPWPSRPTASGLRSDSSRGDRFASESSRAKVTPPS